MRLFLAVLVATLVLAAAPVRAEEPLRSGRILAAHADSSEYTWVYPWGGCSGAPECIAWLESDCSAELAGRDPAVTSSIENVTELADGTTGRMLAFRDADSEVFGSGRLIVEFWTADCHQIVGSYSAHRVVCSNGCRFRIPRLARWMTITSKPQNASVEWTLT